MTIKEKLASEELRSDLAQKLNDAVDIPMISEKTEGKIAMKVVNLVCDALADAVEDVVG